MTSIQPTLNIVFVVYENILATSLSLPMELMQSAASLARAPRLAAAATNAHAPKLNIMIASIDGQSKKNHTGLDIQVDCALSDIEGADIIFLPALWRNPFPIVKNNLDICDWLQNKYSNDNTLIAGVGTGCCFIAEAGLLDGKVATTHWYFFDRFKKRYPKVKLQPKYFITQSDRIYCTGSVNTLGDLTIHFISQYFSNEISIEVERHFFHDVRQGYSKLALLDELSSPHPDEAMLEVQAHIQKNMSEGINFNDLAQSVGMSRRNFDRRFGAASGQSPLNYMRQLRMETAQDLLKGSNLSISEIMFHVGYQDATHFCNLFKKHNGSTPRQYRKTVRAKLFNVD